MLFLYQTILKALDLNTPLIKPWTLLFFVHIMYHLHVSVCPPNIPLSYSCIDC